MLTTKDAEGFLKNFAGLARCVVAIPIPRQEKSLSADAVAGAAKAVNLPAKSALDVESALRASATLDLSPPPRVLITGSLYLAGEVLAQNGTPPA
jgi:dihydrofolate synthase/folylpolyglutamate synthase